MYINLKQILDVHKSVPYNRNTKTHMCTKNIIVKGQDYMENGKKMYVTVEEAAEMLGVSTGYAYKIIWGLNEELKVKGYRTICGKVPTKYFEEKFYGLTVAM